MWLAMSIDGMHPLAAGCMSFSVQLFNWALRLVGICRVKATRLKEGKTYCECEINIHKVTILRFKDDGKVLASFTSENDTFSLFLTQHPIKKTNAKIRTRRTFVSDARSSNNYSLSLSPMLHFSFVPLLKNCSKRIYSGETVKNFLFSKIFGNPLTFIFFNAKFKIKGIN